MTQARDARKKTVDLLERRKPEEHQLDNVGGLHPLLHLQRLAGNRAVVHLLESQGQLQTKLRASEPGDQHEQEAERAEAQVLSLSSAPGDVVQRKCAACSPGAKCAACAEEEETIQRKAKSPSVLSSTVPQIQRAPRNGNSPTPDAATEPTAVASAAGPLIVEDDAATVAPGQMRKSEFLEQLRSTVCTTADEALAEAGQSTEGCPYIEQWLSHYADQAPAHIERALRKYAPEAASATSARDYIPAVSNRVRRAVATWARTGEITGVPDELKGMLPGSGGALGAVAGMIGGAVSGIVSGIGSAVSAAAGAVGSAFSSIGRALFKRKEGRAGATDAPQEIQAQLSDGQPLDGGVGSRMGAAFGRDFSGVRVHTGAQAAGLSDRLNARAFTIGGDIAFGPGEYQPGTLIGDALIAHELAHVVQQSGGKGSTAPQSKGGAGHDALEEEADVAAVGAVSTLWLGAQGALANIGRQAMPRLRSGLQLQRCSKKKPYPVVDVSTLSAGRIREAALQLSQSDQEIDRNTARQLAEGHIHAYYFEDLTQPSNINQILTAAGFDPAVFTIYQHPVSNANMFVQKNFQGFRPYAYPTDIFGFRSLSVDRWRMLLVHETSHALNPVPSGPLANFKEEFRAYWVAEYRGVSDLDDRARQIRAHILQGYPLIKAGYDSDPAVKTAIDAYNRPEGDVTNVTGLSPLQPAPAGH